MYETSIKWVKHLSTKERRLWARKEKEIKQQHKRKKKQKQKQKQKKTKQNKDTYIKPRAYDWDFTMSILCHYHLNQ